MAKTKTKIPALEELTFSCKNLLQEFSCKNHTGKRKAATENK